MMPRPRTHSRAVSPERRRALRRSFATIVSASAAPYGYTISVWSSGALLIHFRHLPTVGEVFLFALGAVSAFMLLWAVGRRAIEHERPFGQGPARVYAGALDIFAVGLAVGSAALLGMIRSWVTWPLTSFVVTLVYMVVASAQLAIAQRRDPERQE